MHPYEKLNDYEKWLLFEDLQNNNQPESYEALEFFIAKKSELLLSVRPLREELEGYILSEFEVPYKDSHIKIYA